MTTAEAIAEGLVPYYCGYYRESAKYKTEWMCIDGSYNRRELNRRLAFKIRCDREDGYYGSRVKIVKTFRKA